MDQQVKVHDICPGATSGYEMSKRLATFRHTRALCNVIQKLSNQLHHPRQDHGPSDQASSSSNLQ